MNRTTHESKILAHVTTLVRSGSRATTLSRQRIRPCPLRTQKRPSAMKMRSVVKGQERKSATSFDHLVGGREKRRWDGQAKRIGGFEIDHELVFGWRLDRQIGRFLAFEDTINIRGSAWVIVN
jgi:hypothetical protein